MSVYVYVYIIVIELCVQPTVIQYTIVWYYVINILLLSVKMHQEQLAHSKTVAYVLQCQEQLSS